MMKVNEMAQMIVVIIINLFRNYMTTKLKGPIIKGVIIVRSLSTSPSCSFDVITGKVYCY